jgi:hypothetical protein
VRGENSIGAISDATRVARHDPEMIPGVRTQAREVRKDILIIIPSPGPRGGGEPVVGRGSVLKMYCGGKSVRINRPVQSC